MTQEAMITWGLTAMSQHKKATVALVVPAFHLSSGGVGKVAEFLYRVIATSEHYTPEVVSLALSSRDVNSVRLLAPPSWLKGVGVTTGVHANIPYRHVGALAAEFEFQRYQPRDALNRLLQHCDLVQVVAGTPAWALAVSTCQQPVLLHFASLAQLERTSRLEREKSVLRFWRRYMLQITTVLDYRALSRANKVFVMNQWLHQKLSHHFGGERMVFAPPGIDTDCFFPSTYCADSYILSVGRFSDYRKNVRLLFTVYHRLQQQGMSLPRLVLAGQAPTAEDWDYAITLGITDQIDIYEQIPLQQLAQLYRKAALFVLSSNEEGFGLVILEAMASGVPVVSTDCGGPATTVINGQTGYLTPVGDAAALAAAIADLLANPVQRQQMGQNGRQVIEQRFSRAVTGQAFLRQYDTLLGR